MPVSLLSGLDWGTQALVKLRRGIGKWNSTETWPFRRTKNLYGAFGVNQRTGIVGPQNVVFFRIAGAYTHCRRRPNLVPIGRLLGPSECFLV